MQPTQINSTMAATLTKENQNSVSAKNLAESVLDTKITTTNSTLHIQTGTCGNHLFMSRPAWLMMYSELRNRVPCRSRHPVRSFSNGVCSSCVPARYGSLSPACFPECHSSVSFEGGLLHRYMKTAVGAETLFSGFSPHCCRRVRSCSIGRSQISSRQRRVRRRLLRLRKLLRCCWLPHLQPLRQGRRSGPGFRPRT